MTAVFSVGIGGFIGSIFRYFLGQIPIQKEYPIMTIIINLMGSIAIGFLSELFNDNPLLKQNTKLFLMTGFCGGFTTFSTFSLETVNLLKNSKYMLGFMNATVSVVICLIGVCLGMVMARLIIKKI